MQISPETARKFKIDPKVAALEWYDNSTLTDIDSCHRLGFYLKELVIPSQSAEPEPIKGISFGGNHGTRYGSCIHAALATFYSGIKVGHTRRASLLNACRQFSSTHQKLFPHPELLDKKHEKARGLDVLDMYSEHYSHDDDTYLPVEVEIFAAVVIKPQQKWEIFEPFLWVVRADGLFKRLFDSTYWILETKSTGSSIEQKLEELKISRQPQGYAFTFSNPKWLPKGIKIKGVLANVIAVRSAETDPKKLFKRQSYHYYPQEFELWRLETIEKVERWRDMRNRAQAEANLIRKLSIFDRRTEQCFRHGKCPAFDLCEYGLKGVDWSRMLPNTWNPLTTED